MWFVLSACQGPFATDRHDLVGFRVAAIGASPAIPGGRVVPRTALIVDGHPWADAPVDLRWYWLADPSDLVPLDPGTDPDAEGPEPLLTVGDRRTLGLVAVQADRTYRAYVTIASTAPTFLPATEISLGALDLSVAKVDGAALQLDARAKLSATPAETIPEGGFGRLEANVGGDPLVRWMATRGTFFELDRHTTDWAAGDLALDGEDLADGATALDQGPVTVLALMLGEPGETAFRATDLYVGDEPPGLWVQGRYVPTDPADGALTWSPGDSVRGTLALDDASPTGIVLTGGAVERSVVDWGTENLGCARPLQGPFDPGWLLTGVCTRTDVEGVEVVVVPETGR